MGALGFTFVTPEAARAWVHKYYNNLLNNSKKLTDYPSNPNVAMVSGFMCAATDEEAEAKAAGWTFFIFALSYYGRKGVDAPGTSDLWKEYQSWKGDRGAQGARFPALSLADTIRKSLAIPQSVSTRDPLEQAADHHQESAIHWNCRKGGHAEFHAARPTTGGSQGDGARDVRRPHVQKYTLQPTERAHRPPNPSSSRQDGEKERRQARGAQWTEGRRMTSVDSARDSIMSGPGGPRSA